jgi:NCAIR mutase (PurE)-related protein
LWQRCGVTTTEAIQLLEKFRAGGVGRDQVLRAFQAAPVADLGFARVDTHRALRKGFPEVIFGGGKTPDQVVKIAAKILASESRVLITRVTDVHARALRKKFKPAVHHKLARCVTIEKKPLARRTGTIGIICAGTSDLPVAVFLCGAVLGVMGRDVVVKLSAAWGGLRKHKPLVSATLDWLKRPSPKLIPPEDRLAIGGGMI